MRKVEELLSNSKLRNIQLAKDGGHADIHIGGWDGSVIWSNGAGWEHVSVSPYARRITPTWDDMCALKAIFFNDDEVAIQIHPAKVDYVNNLPNCLHLWSCSYKPMVLPPSILVGIREGQTPQEIRAELKAAFEIAGEKYE